MWNFQWELSYEKYHCKNGIHESALNYLFLTLCSWDRVLISIRGDLKPIKGDGWGSHDTSHGVEGLVSMPGQFPLWVFVRYVSRAPWRRHFGYIVLFLFSYNYLAAACCALQVVNFLLKQKITVVRRQQKPKTRLTMSEVGGMQLECVGESLLGLMFNTHLKGNNDLGYS